MYGNQKYILNLINWYKFWEEVRNGLPFLLGSGHPVGGGVRATNDGHRIILPEETASVITVFEVWGGDDVGVAGSPPTDAAHEGNGRETAPGYHNPQQRATHL